MCFSAKLMIMMVMMMKIHCRFQLLHSWLATNCRKLIYVDMPRPTMRLFRTNTHDNNKKEKQKNSVSK